MTRETHALVVRGWLTTLAVADEFECGWRSPGSWPLVQARREIRTTFLRPIAYFGENPSLEIAIRGHAAKELYR